MSEMWTPDVTGLTGYRRQNENQEHRTAKIGAAVTLWADAMSGRAPAWLIQEALSPRTPSAMKILAENYPGVVTVRETMTTSDFPYLTGDVLDRMMIGAYQDFPSPWRTFAKVNPNLRDFRTVNRYYLDGAEGVWGDAVAELAEPDEASVSEGRYQYTPKKYAKKMGISWEAILNDDLGAFSDLPARLGRGGARTVSKYVTGLYVDTSGPHASLYTAGNGNIVTSNPALSVTALGTALAQWAAFVDTDGEPIFVEEAILVVCPALKVTANNLMNQLTVDLTADETNRTVRVNNWIIGNLQVVVDPYIPIVASSSNGSTSWFLFANPSMGRPALEVGFLSGFADPVLYQKASNSMRLSGGVDQMAGDFDTMSTEYKGVIAFGGTRMDVKSTMASNGSGS